MKGSRLLQLSAGSVAVVATLAEVSGMVLVDSAHEDYSIRHVMRPHIKLGLLTAPFGIPRLFAGLFVSENPIFAPDSKYPPSYRAVATSTKYLNTVRREWAAVDESWGQARGAEKSLGDRPLVVLLAASEHPLFPVALKLQKELVGRSAGGRLVLVGKTGHHIQHDRPDAVIEAVREVLEVVRRGSTGARQVAYGGSLTGGLQ